MRITGIYINPKKFTSTNILWVGNVPSDLAIVINSNLSRTLSWTINSLAEDGFKIERSSDWGVTYSVIATVDRGIGIYDDTTILSSTYYYRVRAYKANYYSLYSGVVNTNNVVLHCNATAGAVKVITLAGIIGTPQVKINWGGAGVGETDVIMDGATHVRQMIYSANGSYIINILNASSIYAFESSVVYNDVSCFNSCTGIVGISLSPGAAPYMAWTGTTNGWSTTVEYIDAWGGINSVTGDAGRFPNLKGFNTCDGYSTFYGILNQSSMIVIYIGGLNTINCDITSMTSLQKVEKVGAGSTVTGSLNNKPDFYWICVDAPNTISGDGTGNNKSIMTYLSCEGDCTFGWDITTCTELWYFAVGGYSTFIGSIAGLTKLEIFGPGPCTITKPTTVVNNPRLSCFYATSSISLWIWTSSEVNQILADIWANRDVARVHAPNTYRYINLVGGIGTEAPVGQGLIDKGALQGYRSPNNNPVYSLWTITTV